MEPIHHKGSPISKEDKVECTAGGSALLLGIVLVVLLFISIPR